MYFSKYFIVLISYLINLTRNQFQNHKTFGEATPNWAKASPIEDLLPSSGIQHRNQITILPGNVFKNDVASFQD